MQRVNLTVETEVVFYASKFVMHTRIALTVLMKLLVVYLLVSICDCHSMISASVLCLAHRPFGRCFPKEFSCGGQPQCIDFSRVCDGEVDCQDQSDEATMLCKPSGLIELLS